MYIWGSISSKFGETYKINDPKMLFQVEKESENERRYLKIECSLDDLYFLDSEFIFIFL